MQPRPKGISLIEAWQALGTGADLFVRRPVGGVPAAIFASREEAETFAKTYGWETTHEVVPAGNRWLLKPMEYVA